VARRIAALGDKWAPFPEPLAGHGYRALRLEGEALDANPFVVLADGVPGAREAMGKETLVVVGAMLPDGKPGFVILDGTADPGAGNRGNGEELQDHSCALARG
jgi:CDP-diacylglycerol pyrophosphatase